MEIGPLVVHSTLVQIVGDPLYLFWIMGGPPLAIKFHEMYLIPDANLSFDNF